jgi:hypothetical protein
MSSTTSMGSGACAATAAVSTAAVSAMMAAPGRTGRARERYRKIMPGIFDEEGGVRDAALASLRDRTPREDDLRSR